MNDIQTIFRFFLTQKRRSVLMSIYGNKVYIRRKTPDLTVALESLGTEFQVAKYFLPENFSGLIVDGGGYIGTASIAFSNLFPSSKIVLIEPSNDNFYISEKNVKNISNIHAENAALVVDEKEVVSLHDRRTKEWGFSIVPDSNLSVIQQCEIITLNQIFNIYSNLEFGLIKLDIEGYELQLIEFAGEELNRFKVIIIELHERIQKGIESSFQNFNSKFNRLFFKCEGEKYISINQDWK